MGSQSTNLQMDLHRCYQTYTLVLSLRPAFGSGPPKPTRQNWKESKLWHSGSCLEQCLALPSTLSTTSPTLPISLLTLKEKQLRELADYRGMVTGPWNPPLRSRAPSMLTRLSTMNSSLTLTSLNVSTGILPHQCSTSTVTSSL